MKKTQKTIFKLFGLSAVVAMTSVALLIPSPGASAATSSVTDTITIRVLDGVPATRINSPFSGEAITALDQPIDLTYVNMDNYTISITFIDKDGAEYTEVIETKEGIDGSGDARYDFRQFGEEYGYGKYVITVTGTGIDQSTVEDSIEFEYVAVLPTVNENTDNGNPIVDLDYVTDDDGLDEEDVVDHIVIEVLDPDGNPIPGLSPITIKAPVKEIEIPFDQYDLPNGDYTLVVTPYNVNDEELYRQFTLIVHYQGEESMVVPSTADTGGLFKNLNIADSDYLITGLGIFLIVGIGSIIYINKRGKTSRKR